MKQARSRERPFHRHAPTLPPGRRILIACEGEASEPGYFDEIRISRRLPSVRIYIVPHMGTDPLTVVRAAVQERDFERKQLRWGDGDEAWAVFDGDEHRAHSLVRWNLALELARRLHINLAISNPSFELWFLLHFQDQNAHLHRDKANEYLRRHIPDYQKGARIYETHLKVHTDGAIQRATALDRLAVQNGSEAYSNPSTGIGALVRRLLEL